MCLATELALWELCEFSGHRPLSYEIDNLVSIKWSPFRMYVCCSKLSLLVTPLVLITALAVNYLAVINSSHRGAAVTLLVTFPTLTQAPLPTGAKCPMLGFVSSKLKLLCVKCPIKL